MAVVAGGYAHLPPGRESRGDCALLFVPRCPWWSRGLRRQPKIRSNSLSDRVSHGTRFLAPGSLARRRLARVIHHHHHRIRCRVRSVVVLRPLATGRCYPPREAAHRPRSNGALLNQPYSRRLPPTRRRSRHRLRRRRPRGALRIQLTADDPDATVRVSAACDLATSQTALFARAPARTEPGRGRHTQGDANARTAATCVTRTFQSDSPAKWPSSDCISRTTKLRVEANHHLSHRPPRVLVVRPDVGGDRHRRRRRADTATCCAGARGRERRGVLKQVTRARS